LAIFGFVSIGGGAFKVTFLTMLALVHLTLSGKQP